MEIDMIYFVIAHLFIIGLLSMMCVVLSQLELFYVYPKQWELQKARELERYVKYYSIDKYNKRMYDGRHDYFGDEY
jgi:hypothetical protein